MVLEHEKHALRSEYSMYKYVRLFTIAQSAGLRSLEFFAAFVAEFATLILGTAARAELRNILGRALEFFYLCASGGGTSIPGIEFGIAVTTTTLAPSEAFRAEFTGVAGLAVQVIIPGHGVRELQ